MLSSTSSSEAVAAPPERDVPERPVPAIRMDVAGITALVVFLAAMGSWEWYWRAWGSTPAYQNSDGLWAMQRRRIDNGEGGGLVIVGSSRVLFDVQLDRWERLAGERPIQLAVEGTTPLFAMEDLAANENFRGRLLVGVAPDVFFTGFTYRANLYKHYLNETPSQRAGQWLSMRLIDPYFAFFDPDFALMAVLKRQAWPARAGVPLYTDVRKLSIAGADRDTRMWGKVERDPAYRALAQSIWAQFFDAPLPGIGGPEDLSRLADAEIARAAAAIAKLRARGVDVVFVRAPSNGPYYDFEQRVFPRARTWEVLLERTGAPGIHFEDYPDMQGLDLPEWSHLSVASAEQYTEALYRAVEGLRQRAAARPPAAGAGNP